MLLIFLFFQQAGSLFAATVQAESRATEVSHFAGHSADQHASRHASHHGKQLAHQHSDAACDDCNCCSMLGCHPAVSSPFITSPSLQHSTVVAVYPFQLISSDRSRLFRPPIFQ